MSFDSLLTHQIVVEHASPTSTDAAGQPTFTKSVESVAGLIQEGANVWPMGPGADPLILAARIFLPFGTAVAELDSVRRIDVSPEQRYQVLGVNDAAGHAHHLELAARRIPL